MTPTTVFQETVSAANDLIAGILWLRQGGPLKAFNVAYSARDRLLSLKPGQFQGKDRTQLFQLRQSAIEATKGRCSRWNAELLRDALAAIEARGKLPLADTASEKVETLSTCEVPLSPNMEPRLVQDIRSGKWRIEFGQESDVFPELLGFAGPPHEWWTPS